MNMFSKAKTSSFIRKKYRELGNIGPMEITTYGPPAPDHSPQPGLVVTTNGGKIKHASSNSNQGNWLSRLANEASKQGNKQLNIIEIGTCAGISAMYLLSGIYHAQSRGGHIITFEGSHELAKIADKNIREFIDFLGVDNLSVEIVVGPLDSQFSPRLDSLGPDCQIGLAFIDGNHMETATLEYHAAIRPLMSPGGIIVHDDISWGDGMKRAWKQILETEKNCAIDELMLGGIPSRGVIYLDKPGGVIKQINTDNIISRFGRRLKRAGNQNFRKKQQK